LLDAGCNALKQLTSHRLTDMRRRLSALLLALCLVLSQQGALLHDLRHGIPGANATVNGEESHPAGMTCSACLAFAHIVGAVVSATVPALLLSLEFHWPADSPFAHRPADTPQARARDPPELL
jgi:hypothetical protein